MQRAGDRREKGAMDHRDRPGGRTGRGFFAECALDPGEFLSPGVTIDVNESLKLHVGDSIYSNLYRPLLKILADDVGEHDLLHPCCRREMYDFFYRNGEGHPNCLDNINACLKEARPIIHPVNLFMHTEICTAGLPSAVRSPRREIALCCGRKPISGWESRLAAFRRATATAGSALRSPS